MDGRTPGAEILADAIYQVHLRKKNLGAIHKFWQQSQRYPWAKAWSGATSDSLKWFFRSLSLIIISSNSSNHQNDYIDDKRSSLIYITNLASEKLYRLLTIVVNLYNFLNLINKKPLQVFENTSRKLTRAFEVKAVPPWFVALQKIPLKAGRHHKETLFLTCSVDLRHTLQSFYGFASGAYFCAAPRFQPSGSTLFSNCR